MRQRAFFSHFYMLMFPSLAMWVHRDFEMSLAYGLKFILVFGIGAFAVRLVRWLIAQGRSEAVYTIQVGLIVVEIGIVSVILALSRGRSFRNT